MRCCAEGKSGSGTTTWRAPTSMSPRRMARSHWPHAWEAAAVLLILLGSLSVLATPAEGATPTSFVFSHPASVTVGSAATITVQVVDGSNDPTTELAEAFLEVYASASVSSGSVSGTDGGVFLTDGVGTFSLSSDAAQVITLSLFDVFTTGLSHGTSSITFANDIASKLTIGWAEASDDSEGEGEAQYTAGVPLNVTIDVCAGLLFPAPGPGDG